MRKNILKAFVPLFFFFGFSGLVIADLNQGIADFNNGNYSSALSTLSPLAKKGNSQAQAIVGTMHFNGQGVERNPETAFKWYSAAAKKGNSDAQANLGLMYMYGGSVEQNLKQAAKWYKKAANQEHPVAQNNLALMHINGKGVKKDDLSAFRLFTSSANQGYAPAQNNLGLVFLEGKGTEKSSEKALAWFRRAAEQGNSDALNNLGRLFQTGTTAVESNPPYAAQLFFASASKGDILGQYNIGFMYANGIGVQQNYILAHMWWRVAARRGYQPASQDLLKLAERMTPEDITVAENRSNDCINNNFQGCI